MKKNARRDKVEAHAASASASPATSSPTPMKRLPGSPKKGRRVSVEAQSGSATSTPATVGLKPDQQMPGSLNSTVEAIRAHHRERRFAMGIQQVLDRKLESFIRINKTEWHVGDDEAVRDKANKEVTAKIKAARDGDGDASIIMVVSLTDKARAPADAERARHEKEMETLARSLPVAPWVETVSGLGYLGLATIIAETGDLSMYSNVAKVWKRLGYAPHDGLAGSSWKRPSWRKGREALTAEEWIAHPFSGRRYALIHTISVWLKNKQWIGAAKSEDGVGKPNGKYGEVYAKRRAHTAETHPDWSKQHAHMDALRVMMKEVLKDLYLEWNPEKKKIVGRHGFHEAQSGVATAASPAKAVMKPRKILPGSPLPENGRHQFIEAQQPRATAEPGQCGLEILGHSAGLTTSRSVALRQLKPTTSMRPEPGHHRGETQIYLAGLTHHRRGRQRNAEAHFARATESPVSLALKPIDAVPGSPLPENGRHQFVEAQQQCATASPAKFTLKPPRAMPGSSNSGKNGRQCRDETPQDDATESPAIMVVKPTKGLPGSPLSENGRPANLEAHRLNATESPATVVAKPKRYLPGSPIPNTVANASLKPIAVMRPRARPSSRRNPERECRAHLSPTR